MCFIVKISGAQKLRRHCLQSFRECVMMCCLGTESNKNPDQVSGTLLNLAERSNGQMECVIGKQQALPLFLLATFCMTSGYSFPPRWKEDAELSFPA